MVYGVVVLPMESLTFRLSETAVMVAVVVIGVGTTIVTACPAAATWLPMSTVPVLSSTRKAKLYVPADSAVDDVQVTVIPSAPTVACPAAPVAMRVSPL